MGSNVVFIVVLIFGVVFYCSTLQASVRNAASPAYSRTTYYLMVAVTAFLMFGGIRGYSSYLKWRLASSPPFVAPPQRVPEVFVRAK